MEEDVAPFPEDSTIDAAPVEEQVARNVHDRVRELEETVRAVAEVDECEENDLAMRTKRKNEEGHSSGKKRKSKKSKKEPKEEELIPKSEKVAREVKPGESVDLTEAARDHKLFTKVFGPMYVLGMGFVARIPLGQLKRGQPHQVPHLKQSNQVLLIGFCDSILVSNIHAVYISGGPKI